MFTTKQIETCGMQESRWRYKMNKIKEEAISVEKSQNKEKDRSKQKVEDESLENE